MKPRILLTALAFVAVVSCDSALTTTPVDRIPSENEIVDAGTARAALIGAYDGLQSLSYYGRQFLVLGDLSSDNVRHRGTFQYLGDIDRNQIQSDNTAITSVWGALYDALARANTVIDRVQKVSGLTDADKNQILGEAYFLRALHLHNLTKFWGDVPMPLTPITNANDAALVTRTAKAQVYTQILADLAKAEAMITNAKQTRQASLGAVRALRARVMLYQGNYQGALDATTAVLAMGYALEPTFANLNTADGTATPEDIFRVVFTPQEYNEMGYYYLRAGRREVAPTPGLNAAFEVGDVRKAATVAPSGSEFQGTKWPTTIGGEDIHVIRLAEVILIRAEAYARLNGAGQLGLAVAEYNKIRVRAKLAPHVLGVDVTTQADVLNAIDKERRLELALEGDRWPDLNRTGRAAAVMNLTPDRTFQLLYPIPAREVVVAPGLTQNPGY
ncbi:MAG: RagB/SusD family nutrient uptake outer membrane protein [Gemmatimonadaceae bacterium]